VQKRRAYAQAVKERENAIVESQEAIDDAVDNKEKYQAHKEAWDRMFEYQKQQIAKREAAAAEEAELKAKDGTQPTKDGDGENENKAAAEEPAPKKKEDPMDYMPPPPQTPPPERFVTVPDIPIPPSPPSVFEIDEGSNDNLYHWKDEERLDKMYAPKLDPKLIQHLDPDCFLPTVEGRYFGLLSNSIADPQFVGYSATGIRGVTPG
jgi:hypothetical protein